MGRHSRRGPAPKSDSGDIPAARRKERPAAAPGSQGTPPGARGGEPGPRGDLPRPDDTPGFGGGTRARGVPGFGGGAPGQGAQPFPPGGQSFSTSAPGQGAAGFPPGTPARGVPQGTPGFPPGTPAQGIPRLPDGTPARGVPRLPDEADARGGHPEQREAGGGWGEFTKAAGAGGPGVTLPRQRRAPGRTPGPRQDYLDAFEAGRTGARSPEGTDEQAAAPGAVPPAGTRPAEAPQADVPAQRGSGRGRTYTGIAAAAVTTVLAVVVAGQVAGARGGGAAPSAADRARDTRATGGATPSAAPGGVTLTYEQKMDRTYPLSAKLKGSGKFDAVPGFDKAPGTGQKYRYRIDVEQGLGLDGALFAEAVQKTLNDDRSWAHGGAKTFERISSGKPDFVITLASPGTTAQWCAKSGLDTTEDNVSCDSAATERVMINAYRWAQGSKTYGNKIHAYRQMLINHEVGHRLGHGHVSCQKDGELAPVMQQQTKFLNHDGIHCLPNPWPYPGS
ncbi:DUF3152 domain-containing protein [Streptomyces sp. NPDC127190]|uniref:DUF3152 domain-containing protein n=1 Tax=unclassified Streptomyces TaxID=2593676 RepID=UPI003634A4F8